MNNNILMKSSTILPAKTRKSQQLRKNSGKYGKSQLEIFRFIFQIFHILCSSHLFRHFLISHHRCLNHFTEFYSEIYVVFKFFAKICCPIDIHVAFVEQLCTQFWFTNAFHVHPTAITTSLQFDPSSPNCAMSRILRICQRVGSTDFSVSRASTTSLFSRCCVAPSSSRLSGFALASSLKFTKFTIHIET